MAATLVNVALMICLTGTFGHMVSAAQTPPLLLREPASGNQPLLQNTLEPDTKPHQWQDLVNFINRNIELMDRLLMEKDERIDRMELTVAGQMTEIKQLKRGVTSLEKEVAEKNEVVDKLEARVSDLERVLTSDNIQGDRESRQTLRYPVPKTENGTQLDLGETPDLLLGPTVNKMLLSKSSVPRKSNHQADDALFTHSKPEIQNEHIDSSDQSDEDNTENGFKNSRFHQKREAPSTHNTIAFHTTMSATKNVTEDDGIVYDQAILDTGAGYSTREGIYTVPESGTYVITWTSICGFHSKFQTLLVVNGAVRGSSWTDAESVNDEHQSTAIVVLTLNQGDHVLIRMSGGYGHGMLVSTNYVGASTFSGWKLN